jgi:predicted ATPase
MERSGGATPELQRAYARARELCRGMGDSPALFPVLFGLCLYYLGKPDLPASRSLAAQCLRVARGAGDDDLLLEACGVAGTASMYGGRLVAARTLLERGFALYRPERHGDHAARYGQDPVTTPGFVARVHALLGRPDLARRRGEALLAALHAHLALLHLVLRDAPAALRHAEAVVAVASGQGLPLWLGLGRMYRGAALVEGGLADGNRPRIAEGIADGREGLAAYRATGAGLDVPTCLCWLGAGLTRLGEVDAASRLLDEARRVVEDTGEAYLAAELHRVVGELHAASGSSGDPAAEASLRASLSVARRQRANLLELRAGTSLARLWRRQGRGEQVRGLLAPLCEPFPGGDPCRDLAEARAVLGAGWFRTAR